MKGADQKDADHLNGSQLIPSEVDVMSAKNAKFVRMVTPDHPCQWGIKTKDLLDRYHFPVDDQHLTSMDANRSYKKEQGYEETSQIFIEDQHIGGYKALGSHLGMKHEERSGQSYPPNIAIFFVSLLMALAASYAISGSLSSRL